MALFHEIPWQNGHQVSIWKIEEDELFFLDRLDLHEKEKAELEKIKGRKRLEWLASRHLVHLMVSDEPEWDRIPLLKDEFGKPHLNDHELHVSFSHSKEFVAVILGKMSVGIDIQRFVPRISAIAHKYMREEEFASLADETRLEHLHYYWGAKEALYKCYGRKELEFKGHILIEPFKYTEKGNTSGIVHKDAFHQKYELTLEKMGDYFLVYALAV